MCRLEEAVARLERRSRDSRAAAGCGGWHGRDELLQTGALQAQEVGPRRAWPGGLAVARTLGDSDAGSYVLPQPALQAVTLPTGGAAVVICSDGVWDAVGVENAAHMLQVR